MCNLNMLLIQAAYFDKGSRNCLGKETPIMTMRRFAIVLTMMACLGLQLHAQRLFLNTPDAYLDQAPPSDTPKIFAPGLLAAGSTFVMAA